MGNPVTGEAMPKNLSEALALDAILAANHDPDDEAGVEAYLSNWEAIYSGRFPISSPGEAVALLRRMAAELEHSSGDFVDGVLEQVSGFIADLAGARALEPENSRFDFVKDAARSPREPTSHLTPSKLGE